MRNEFPVKMTNEVTTNTHEFFYNHNNNAHITLSIQISLPREINYY